MLKKEEENGAINTPIAEGHWIIASGIIAVDTIIGLCFAEGY